MSIIPAYDDTQNGPLDGDQAPLTPQKDSSGGQTLLSGHSRPPKGLQAGSATLIKPL